MACLACLAEGLSTKQPVPGLIEYFERALASAPLTDEAQGVHLLPLVQVGQMGWSSESVGGGFEADVAACLEWLFSDQLRKSFCLNPSWDAANVA